MAGITLPLPAWGFPKGLFHDGQGDIDYRSQEPTTHAHAEQADSFDTSLDYKATRGVIEGRSDVEQQPAGFSGENPETTHQVETSVDGYNTALEKYLPLDDLEYHSLDQTRYAGDQHGSGGDVDLSWYLGLTNNPLNDADETLRDTGSISEEASDSGGIGLRRTLRPLHDRSLAVANAWLDKDDTGDYDPVEEQRQLRRKRRRILKDSESSAVRNGLDHIKHGSNRSITCANPRTPTILKLHHVANKLKFAKLAAELSSLSASDIETERRLRTTEVRAQRLNAVTSEYNLPDDLTGHPVRRGCYGCAGLAERCSLLDDERVWPCQTCLETGKEDCDLIAPPLRKLACQLCKRLRMPCSFAFSRNQDESCHACLQKGFRCVAGPVKDLIQPRIRYDRDWQSDPLPKRKTPKTCGPCLECSGKGHDCSLTVDNDGVSSCQQCQTQGLPCTVGQNPTLHSLPIPHDRHPASDQSEAAKPVAPPSNPQMPTDPPKAQTYSLNTTTSIIHTSFAHPMLFNAPADCHFCLEPAFALFGLGRTSVAVHDARGSGGGWIETCGGHRAMGGVKSTRLCIPCTTQRLGVVMCEKHVTREIACRSSAGIETGMVAVEALMGEGGQGVDLGVHCSLCPSLAGWECEVGGGRGGGESGAGCGLKLCERCMLVLVGTHGGSLDAMLAQVEHGPSEGRPFGFRADCELLRQEGPLMKFFSWMCRDQDGMR